ncbi:MAG: redox-sensing transcriptional repressor Rex [Chloroflexi bacterium]|nr:redox-sensing transcriptional repressor Rex [Chloroflexota bacterium]
MISPKNGESADDIPDIAIQRLPLYLRALMQMQSQHQRITSSQEMASHLHISSAQIRKDLSYFGEFGKQGTGYEIPYLIDQLKDILHLNAAWGMALVGAGDLGRALVRYNGFRPRGFYVAAIFDSDPAKIGNQVGDVVIHDVRQITSVVSEMGLRIGVVAVPPAAAQRVAEALVKGGVVALLNYAPITLNLPDTVRVHYIDPVAGLQSMTYYLPVQD